MFLQGTWIQAAGNLQYLNMSQQSIGDKLKHLQSLNLLGSFVIYLTVIHTNFGLIS